MCAVVRQLVLAAAVEQLGLLAVAAPAWVPMEPMDQHTQLVAVVPTLAKAVGVAVVPWQ